MPPSIPTRAYLLNASLSFHACLPLCAHLAQADDGYLYPLDRAFFYIQKPPMLIPFDEVESVELTRLGGNTVSSKTFDLVVRTRADVEHQFRCVGSSCGI